MKMPTKRLRNVTGGTAENKSRAGTMAVLFGLVSWWAAAPAVGQDVKREHLNPAGLMKPTGYTHVVTATGGKHVYVAGQVSLDAQGNLVGKGDLRAQARQVYLNLRAALAGAGAAPKDIVKLTSFVVGYRPEMLPALREERAAFFGAETPLPASTLLGVQALAREDFLIEIEVVAGVP